MRGMRLGSKRPTINFGFERLQIFLHSAEGHLLLFTLGFSTVHFRAPAVLGRKRAGFEQIQLAYGADILGRLFGKFGYDHIGQQTAHQIALERIVIQEHHRIEADVQLLRIRRMFCALSSQLATKTRCVLGAAPSRCVPERLQRIFRSFLLQTASRMPRFRSSRRTAAIRRSSRRRHARCNEYHLCHRRRSRRPIAFVEIEHHALDGAPAYRHRDIDDVLRHKR